MGWKGQREEWFTGSGRAQSHGGGRREVPGVQLVGGGLVEEFRTGAVGVAFAAPGL